jgi:hypothetical protein
MSYKKQTFTDGQVLTAAQLNHIEDGIVELETNVVDLVLAALPVYAGEVENA